ncbi:glycosyltransferase family 2 protein [Algoriphagus sanaruensis]|uniref:Glycosyltransferase 2-like domain-containing protein n=1 Tax=Algoriphagus sanaruensis TaxID=1727163 RepID=A0A142EQS5_9BACT|nr:glycosyltransferase family A protein [Algoriphagus sanaruensis]AMQ57480.1 hypothetical protein AO498_13610 [Algoriphagus sanaruensis]
MKKPVFFSIVIPFFNREKFLEKAITSVLNQTSPNWELILVDDYSSDNSMSVVNSFSDSRIKILSHSTNKGNAIARNTGWKASTYDWIAYLDSDDWYEPDYLDKITQAIYDHPNSVFFWTGVRFVNRSGSSIKEEFWKPLKVLPSDTFFDQLRIGTNAGVCFSKSVLEELGGFEIKLRASVDREFFLRISQHYEGLGVEFTGVNCLIGTHESVRKSYHHQAKAYDFINEKYKILIKKNSIRKRWWYHKAMWLSLYSGDKGKAFQYLKKMNYPIKSLLLFFFFSVLPTSNAILLHKKFAIK